jgi:hypothetical protein
MPERTFCVDDQQTPGTTGGWRVLRGSVVGFSATLLAVGGHCLAADAPPTWTSIVFLSVLLGAVSIWLSSLRWTVPRLLAVLLLAQAAMHAVFVETAAPVQTGHAGHVHGADHAAAATLLPGDLGMWTGHLAAALATAWLLRRGEAWLGGVLDALALRVFRMLEVVVTVYGPRRQPLPVAVRDVPRQSWGADAWWQRGPPR